MENGIRPLLERIREIQQQIELELERQRKNFDFVLEEKKIWFDARVRQHHLQFRHPIITYLRNARPAVILTAPFIYVLALPLGLLDLLLIVYQQVCFPIYGISKVRRDEYIVVDRGALAYLNAIEKVNCLYCGYAVGLLAMAWEVGSRTEAYWCPIKHARALKVLHDNYFDFAEFGDPEGYRQRIRTARAKPPAPTPPE